MGRRGIELLGSRGVFDRPGIASLEEPCHRPGREDLGPPWRFASAIEQLIEVGLGLAGQAQPQQEEAPG